MTFLSGQLLTAAGLNDAFDAVTEYRYDLGSDHDVTSATGVTLQNTAIVVPVDGLSVVRGSFRFTSNNGGIRYAWSASGTVAALSRDMISPGSSTTATDGSNEIADMRFRQNATLTEEQRIAHMASAATTFLIRELLIVNGTGNLTFRFAQDTSNVAITRLHSQSFATIRRIVDA